MCDRMKSDSCFLNVRKKDYGTCVYGCSKMAFGLWSSELGNFRVNMMIDT